MSLTCPLCGNPVKTILGNTITPSPFIKDVFDVQVQGYFSLNKTSSLHLDIAVCPSCQVLFREPFFSEGELENIYRYEYEHQEEQMKNLNEFVYSNDFYLSKCAHDTLDLVAEINTLCTPINIIFDVGGRDGFRLTELALQGYQCTVIDPIRIRPITRLIKKEYCFLEDIPNTRKADLILLCNIIEHLKDPSKAIVKCREVLSDYGYVFIQVPFEILSIAEWETIGRVFNKSLRVDVTHAFFFTTSSLKYLVEKNGFACVRVWIEDLRFKESGESVLMINLLAKKSNVKESNPRCGYFDIFNPTVISYELHRIVKKGLGRTIKK